MTRALIVATVLLAALPVAAQQMVNSFEDEADLQRASIPAAIAAERVQEHATDGEWALRPDIPGSEQDTWPGVLFPMEADEEWADLDGQEQIETLLTAR